MALSSKRRKASGPFDCSREEILTVASLVISFVLAISSVTFPLFREKLARQKTAAVASPLMAFDSDHSSSEGVGSSATVFDAPPASPVGSAQGSSVPDPVAHPAFIPLQRLEDLVRGIAISVGAGGERYFDALPIVEAGLREIQRAGGISLARQCERELQRIKRWMYRLEELAYEDPSDVPPPLSLRLLLERKERAKQIQAKETELRRLRKRHRAVLDRMDAYLDRAFFEDAGSLRGEAKLREREHEARRLGEAAREVERALQLLHQEEEASKADLVKRQQRQKEKARSQRAADRTKAKAKIGSFSLLKFL